MRVNIPTALLLLATLMGSSGCAERGIGPQDYLDSYDRNEMQRDMEQRREWERRQNEQKGGH